MTQTLMNGNLCQVSYAAIREACNGEPFEMSLVGSARDFVIQAVNMGIDSHLEACFIESQDSYEHAGSRLECSVSPESLPVLLRRLFEDVQSEDDSDDDTPMSVASDILTVLGFDDYGRFVGGD